MRIIDRLCSRYILSYGKILNPVSIVDSIRCFKDVVVLSDGGLVGHQIVLITSCKPIANRDSLDVADIL